ncbi:hypothetical protein OSTOST_21933, partial [Ostertagia ostertagi]
MVHCGICGAVLSRATAKTSSSSEKENAVMLMSLALAGYIEVDYARSFVGAATPRKVCLCDEHFVQAAQFISAEMELMGKRMAEYYDPSSSRPNVYVSNGDIPQHLIDSIKSMATGITTVTSRDVTFFMNKALKRYYSTEIWRLTEQTYVARDAFHQYKPVIKEGKADKKKKGLEQAVPSAPLDESLAFRQPKPEVQMDGEEGDVVAKDNKRFKVMEHRTSENSNTVSGDVEETDEAIMDKFFIVQGRMLMSLFRFCPQCGHRLGKAQLKAEGTAAVVQLCVQYVFREEMGEPTTCPGPSKRTEREGNAVGALCNHHRPTIC